MTNNPDVVEVTPEQVALLKDKVTIWRREAEQGNMELRDYNRRCADALEAVLAAERLREQVERLVNVIEMALSCTPSVQNGRIVYDCGDPWTILQAAHEDYQATKGS